MKFVSAKIIKYKKQTYSKVTVIRIIRFNEDQEVQSLLRVKESSKTKNYSLATKQY